MSTLKKKISAKAAVIRHFSYYKDYKSFKNMVKSFENDDSYLTINDLKIWKKKMLKVAKYGKTFMDIANDFFSTHIKNVKHIDNCDDSPILICVIKNDLARLKVFLDFYRQFGIKHFAFLDDKSSDGTREYLESQDDVDLFVSEETYTTNRRQAWINRLIAYYGLDRWFIAVDSDEFLSIKQKDINELISTLDTNNLKFRCLMVDMYPIDGKYSDDFINSYRGFDTDTYNDNHPSIWFNCVNGGMRRRVFSTPEQQFNPYLVKTPVFKAHKDFIQLNSHFNYPFSYEDYFMGIIRHYKFLKSDFEKYQERVAKQNFVNGSQEYSAYVDKFKGELSIDFKYPGSDEFTSYESFYKINVYKKNEYN